ncbi:restriction endonuclease [Dyella sp. 333MFSha]|uniref:restriction endonuclease n=1 Tax=Dyella sp. 333MFSha TaxID=1798240 RepID=UPI00087F7FFF|nr:restriction endonuclease [Dyella sp. 333MFSha]SDG53598.1 Restriction endonuclease [Dyella sp. 333MFSha]
MSRRWKPVRSRWTDPLTQVPWDDFERRVAEYYRGQGYRVDHSGTGVGHAMADGGIDLKLYRDGEYIVVQCKHWNTGQVPHNAVHELIGVMHTEGAQRAILISSGEFTDHAMRSAAKFMPIQLIGGAEIRSMLGPIPEVDMPPLDDRPSWVAASRTRPRVSASTSGTPIIAVLAVVAVLLISYLSIPRVLDNMGKSIIQSTSQGVANARANAAAPTRHFATRPSDYYSSRLATPPAVSHQSYATMTRPTAAPRPPITRPDGTPVSTGSTPTSDADIATWQAENAKAMKILEKTTPELGTQ